MTLMPIASFLAGSLLSILLPTLLLIALVVWYLKVVRRVPETGDATELPSAAPGAGSAQGTRPEANPPPSEG
jgi:hypothetical protein